MLWFMLSFIAKGGVGGRASTPNELNFLFV